MNNIEKEKTDYHNLLFKKEWSYETGAMLLAVFATSLVIITGKSWGVSGAFSLWAGKIMETVGINADSWSIYQGSLKSFNFMGHQASLTNLGIVLGALLSTLLAASFKIKKIKSHKQILAALLGGLLMGVGARIALGCNIGSLFSAIPAFSLHGWVFLIFIFLGVATGSVMLKKWFM